MSAPVTTPAIGERVARGAALLDEKLPGWDRDINLGRLDLDSPCRCILGQLHYDEDDPGGSYGVGLDALGIPSRKDWEYGFDIAGDIGSYQRESRILTDAWKRLILARRGSGPVVTRRAMRAGMLPPMTGSGSQ